MQILSKWMMALALSAGCGAATAQTTYSVNFMAESESITGSITLAANALGLITSSEITGWLLSSTPGDPTAFSVNSKDSGSMAICVSQKNCGIDATAESLIFTSLPQTITEIVFNDVARGNVLALNGPGISQGPSPGVLISNSDGVAGYGLSVGTRIATRAPEIDSGSAAAGMALLFGSLAVLRGRRVGGRGRGPSRGARRPTLQRGLAVGVPAA